MKILIICDSHGDNYGVESYPDKLKKLSEDEISVRTFPGISLKNINNNLAITESYDLIILQLGNPDIHPRMPKKFLTIGKKMTKGIVRDSLFAIPPKINISYILRFPFFRIRLIVIKLRKTQEYYLSDERFKEEFIKIYEKAKEKTERIIIIPLFKVNEDVYGKWHNQRADKLNSWLNERFKEEFFESDIFEYKNYKDKYNKDFFHFNNQFHEEVCKSLILKIRGKYEK